MTALQEQIGGEHYKSMKIQPVEFCMTNGFNFCQSSAIKYICRYKTKNGEQDIDKAIHFLELLKQLEYPKQESKPETFPKDGDILYRKDLSDEWVYVFKNIKDKDFHERHISYHIGTNDLFYDSSGHIHSSDSRPATEEEKQLLFDRLKKGGKQWNPEKKRIEDIPEEPKIGDWCIFWDYEYKYAFVGVLTNISSSRECSYQMDNAANYMNAVKWDGTREHLEKVRKGL